MIFIHYKENTVKKENSNWEKIFGWQILENYYCKFIKKWIKIFFKIFPRNIL